MRRANDRCLNGFIYVTLPGGVRACGGLPPVSDTTRQWGQKFRKAGRREGELEKDF